MMHNYENIVKKLSIYNQQHLLKHWNDLTEEQQHDLLKQLDEIDFNDILVNRASQLLTPDEYVKRIDYKKSSIQGVNLERHFRFSHDELNKFELSGLEAIASGKCGIICLAGGMSTRLSISYPKGCYSIDLLSMKSLFQLQAERISRLKHLSCKQSGQSNIPWYIMTSEHTHNETEEFFRQNNYFGLDRADVVMFQQDMTPCLSPANELTLKNKFQVNKAPDGPGGLYKALVKHNILKDMALRGIQYLHVYGVEHVLVKMLDPVFTGFCLNRNINCAAKVVNKFIWNEPMNRVCFSQNGLSLVDYSLLSKQSTQVLIDSEDRNSVFSLGDIGYYFMDLDVLEELCKKAVSQLPFYKLERRLNYLNKENGSCQKQNCFVYERFLTDLFPKILYLLEVDRKSEYSPLVYMSTAQPFNRYACKKNLTSLHYSWLLRAGARFRYPNRLRDEINCIQSRHDELKGDDIGRNICEISPLVYTGLACESLEKYVKDEWFEPPLVLEYDSETKEITYNGLSFISYQHMLCSMNNSKEI